MKKLAIASVLVLGVSGCSSLPKLSASVCEKEPAAHAFYLRFIAPFRSPAQVATAVAFHDKLMQRCAARASQTAIDKAAADAAAARQ